MEELKDIGKRRKALGLKQTELARLAGVSQSLIAKVERGTIEIAYSKAKKIFLALENSEKKEEVKIEEIMTRSILHLKKEDKVSKAIELMKEHKISQLPVFEGKVCVGNISEETIMSYVEKGVKDLPFKKIEEVMGESFPILARNSVLEELTSLLLRNHAVLITDKGNIIGIATRADILKAISKK